MKSSGRPSRIRLSHRLEAFLVGAAERSLARAPSSVLNVLSRVVAVLGFDILRIRRRVVLENLARAFPEWNAAQRRRVGRASYRHAFLNVAELAELSSPKGSRMEVEAIHGERLLDPTRTGAQIAVMGHLGNWEALSHFWTEQGIRGAALYKPLHNPILNERTLAARGHSGAEYISTRLSDREIWRRLSEAARQGKTLGFLLDQDAGRKGTFIPFFGHPASTATGAATLALRYNLPLIPIFSRRLAPRRHRMSVGELIHPPEGGRTPENVEWILRRCTAALEEAIREAPEQYFWHHRRWKTRPKEKRGAPRPDQGRPGDTGSSKK